MSRPEWPAGTDRGEEQWEYIRTSGLHLSPWRQQRGWGFAGRVEDRWTHPTSCRDTKHLCWCCGQTFFISFCNSISPSGLFNDCRYRHHHLFHCFSGVRVHGIVWDLIAFNVKTHRGRYYTEQGVFKASNGTLRLLQASFARLWGVMHCYSWLVLAGIKAKGLLYFYTLPPPQSPCWHQPWTWDCHWPIEKDRKREREG